MVEVDMLRAELHSALMVDIEGATRVYYTERCGATAGVSSKMA